MATMPGLLLVVATLASTILGEFMSMDTNEDRRIPSSEHEVYARAVFNQIDANIDYKLSAAEIQLSGAKFLRHVTAGRVAAGVTEPSPEELFKHFDANGDGFISRGEHANAASAKFQEMDVDHNGDLNREEFMAGSMTSRVR